MEGKYYNCTKCGTEFFVSYEENSCQCSGCMPTMCPGCEYEIAAEISKQASD